MTIFQLLLLIASAIIFAKFFTQLFNGSHPKRGVDFEAETTDEQIGGIARPDKIFSKPTTPPSRIQELHESADEAVQKGDYGEAKKALGSALILDDASTKTLYRLAYVHMQTEEFATAKSYLERLLMIEGEDDMAQAMLANALHRLGEDEKALEHHLLSIKLDPEYASHYFNYANTLYDMEREEEALAHYRKAYVLDPSLEDAKKMIDTLSE